jgi:hypothetical protein
MEEYRIIRRRIVESGHAPGMMPVVNLDQELFRTGGMPPRFAIDVVRQRARDMDAEGEKQSHIILQRSRAIKVGGYTLGRWWSNESMPEDD